MTIPTVKYTPNGLAFLNAGCGGTYSVDWNNVDRKRAPHIVYHDLRKPLPYPDNTFDAVYSSHVLEHLEPEGGDRFLGELFRTCKPGGTCRIVVPDYEQICREYLRCIEAAIRDPDPGAIRRYRWAVLEMIDQLIRKKSGGRMLETLVSGDFDEEYVRRRNGEEFSMFYRSPPDGAVRGSRGKRPWRNFFSAFPSRFSNWWIESSGDPGKTGEAHRWVYDRFGLKTRMETAGFEGVERRTHDVSGIPDWSAYSLDSAPDRLHARKPDSLYMEGIKPGSRKGAIR